MCELPGSKKDFDMMAARGTGLERAALAHLVAAGRRYYYGICMWGVLGVRAGSVHFY